MTNSWQKIITEKNVDTSLNNNSNNPVTSNAIYDGLSGKADINHIHSNLTYEILDAVYPIGSIYMTSSSISPSILFPGTYWDKIEGKFLLGSSSTYTLGDEGGSTDAIVPYHTHTQKEHTHTQNSHDHYFAESGISVILQGNISWSYSSARVMSTQSGSNYYPYSSANTGGLSRKNATNSTTATNQNTTATNQSSGVNGTGKNMPPYRAVNTYERRPKIEITITSTTGGGNVVVFIGHINIDGSRNIFLHNTNTDTIVNSTVTDENREFQLDGPLTDFQNGYLKVISEDDNY